MRAAATTVSVEKTPKAVQPAGSAPISGSICHRLPRQGRAPERRWAEIASRGDGCAEVEAVVHPSARQRPFQLRGARISRPQRGPGDCTRGSRRSCREQAGEALMRLPAPVLQPRGSRSVRNDHAKAGRAARATRSCLRGCARQTSQQLAGRAAPREKSCSAWESQWEGAARRRGRAAHSCVGQRHRLEPQSTCPPPPLPGAESGALKDGRASTARFGGRNEQERDEPTMPQGQVSWRPRFCCRRDCAVGSASAAAAAPASEFCCPRSAPTRAAKQRGGVPGSPSLCCGKRASPDSAQRQCDVFRCHGAHRAARPTTSSRLAREWFALRRAKRATPAPSTRPLGRHPPHWPGSCLLPLAFGASSCSLRLATAAAPFKPQPPRTA